MFSSTESRTRPTALRRHARVAASARRRLRRDTRHERLKDIPPAVGSLWRLPGNRERAKPLRVPMQAAAADFGVVVMRRAALSCWIPPASIPQALNDRAERVPQKKSRPKHRIDQVRHPGRKAGRRIELAAPLMNARPRACARAVVRSCRRRRRRSLPLRSKPDRQRARLRKRTGTTPTPIATQAASRRQVARRLFEHRRSVTFRLQPDHLFR